MGLIHEKSLFILAFGPKQKKKGKKEKENTNSSSSLLDPNKKEIEIDHQAVSVHRKAKGTTLEIYLNASSKPVSVVHVFYFC
jgi:hypothetical protein